MKMPAYLVTFVVLTLPQVAPAGNADYDPQWRTGDTCPGSVSTPLVSR